MSWNLHKKTPPLMYDKIGSLQTSIILLKPLLFETNQTFN